MRSRNPVVKLEGIPSEERRRRRQVTQTWGHHRNLQSFLADYFPQRWEAIRTCGLRFKHYESRARPGYFKLIPFSCHEVPFCIQCSRRDTARRTAAALDAFNSCTPAGKQPRFIHIVQTAPTDGPGGGAGRWGMAASQDPGGFSKLVWETLVEHYGTGIGAVLSYQDFGERGFAKRHPHIDLTLNGWMLQDREARLTPTFNLKSGGSQRWQDSIAARATRYLIDAAPGNLFIGNAISGNAAYYRILRYQLRELVDLRKLDYNRGQGKIWWMSYRDNRREAFTVTQFLDGFQEYQSRLGTWESEGRQALHRRYGHLSDRQLHKTEAAMGGAPIPHGQGCPCSECGDWERVFLDDLTAPTPDWERTAFGPSEVHA